MEFPEGEAKRRELARRVAAVHAQAVIERLNALSCPAEQRARLLDAVKARAREKDE